MGRTVPTNLADILACEGTTVLSLYHRGTKAQKARLLKVTQPPHGSQNSGPHWPG